MAKGLVRKPGVPRQHKLDSLGRLRKRAFGLILTEGSGMTSRVEQQSEAAEQAVRPIRRAARRQYSAEEKVRIVIAGLRGEDSIAKQCRKERSSLGRAEERGR